MLYVTNALLTADDVTAFNQFIDVALNAYGELFNVNKDKLKEFINAAENISVFKIVHCELYDISIQHKDIVKDFSLAEIDKNNVIDPTDEDGYIQREIITTALKKLAKQHANHKCECDVIEDCRYFTSKESGQTYLEIHHLIPREFANDCDSSIEILENYIALCPNCHRKIHLAADGERKHLIRFLFNQRVNNLPTSNMKKIDLIKMFVYYKIDNSA